MKKSLLLLLLVSTSFLACKKDKEETAEINFIPAKTSAELISLRADKNAHIIRSISDFNLFASKKGNAISDLPLSIQSELKASLVIRRDKGVVGLNYSVIKRAITKEEFHEVMALFGLDTKMGFWGFSDDPIVNKMLMTESDTEIENAAKEDYKEYKCLSAHTCQKATDHICLTGC